MKNKEQKMLRKVQVRAEYIPNRKISFVSEHTTEESDLELIARLMELDICHVYNVVSSRPCTEQEIENYVRENAAASYYARYGTELEG